MTIDEINRANLPKVLGEMLFQISGKQVQREQCIPAFFFKSFYVLQSAVQADFIGKEKFQQGFVPQFVLQSGFFQPLLQNFCSVLSNGIGYFFPPALASGFFCDFFLLLKLI